MNHYWVEESPCLVNKKRIFELDQDYGDLPN